MAARHTIIQTMIYTATQKLKYRKHRNNMTQITNPQMWGSGKNEFQIRSLNFSDWVV